MLHCVTFALHFVNIVFTSIAHLFKVAFQSQCNAKAIVAVIRAIVASLPFKGNCSADFVSRLRFAERLWRKVRVMGFGNRLAYF